MTNPMTDKTPINTSAADLQNEVTRLRRIFKATRAAGLSNQVTRKALRFAIVQAAK